MNNQEQIEQVKHPSYWKACEVSMSVLDITRWLFNNYGNIFKYCARAGKKQGESYEKDLRKALEYSKDAMVNQLPITLPAKEAEVWTLLKFYCERCDNWILEEPYWESKNLKDFFKKLHAKIYTELEEVELKNEIDTLKLAAGKEDGS